MSIIEPAALNANPYSSILSDARAEIRNERMGCMSRAELSADGYQTVAESVRQLLAEVEAIESHRCDFGDGDSLCPDCGLDPRS